MTKEDLDEIAQTKTSNAYYRANNQMFDRLLCIAMKNISYYLSEILGKNNKDLLEWTINSTQMLSSDYKLKTRIFWISTTCMIFHYVQIASSKSRGTSTHSYFQNTSTVAANAHMNLKK